MATFKLEVQKQFGAFKVRFTAAPEAACDTIDDVLDLVRKDLDRVDLDTDNVVFRGIAYTSAKMLEQEVRRAPY